MKKDETYHESAVDYNTSLAEAAEAAAERVPHPVVKLWCQAVAKQHRFHENRHRSALKKVQKKTAAVLAEKENAHGQ